MPLILRDACLPNLSQITVVGIGCIYVTMNPAFRTPAYRPFRAAMFVGMGLCAIFPVLHGLVIYGFSRMLEQIGLFWLVLQGTLYITGALLYAVSGACFARN